jgi:hypothetical protein
VYFPFFGIEIQMLQNLENSSAQNPTQAVPKLLFGIEINNQQIISWPKASSISDEFSG